MKTKLPKLKLLIVLCSVCATTAAFGQATTYVWTNQNGAIDNGGIGAATNWSPNGIPNPNSNVGFPGDEIQFNGQTAGPLAVRANAGMNGGSSAGVVGIVVHSTLNQVSPANIYFPLAGFNGTAFRLSNVQADANAGQLSLGDTNSTTSALYTVWGGVGGQIHSFVNNSASPAVLYPALRFAMGGGGAHTFDFSGTGNWYVTNNLVTVNGSPTIITLDGPGTMVWEYAYDSSVFTQNSQIQGPVTINDGTMILRSGNLLNNVLGSQNMTHNGVLLEYNGQTNAFGSVTNGTMALNISGAGPIQIDNGVLTLAGNSTYTGTNILKGGELVAGSVETANPSGPLGEGGANTISFQGGILGYSAFNGFDYSPRFDTSPGQQYIIDTASANVTYTNGLTSSGATLVKLGGGSLTLAGADTYNGLTTVSVGKLVLAGTASSGNIMVADNAALGVVENGTPFMPNVLTLGTSFGATFEANNVTNKNAAPMQPPTLASAGLTTVNVNSGRFRLIGDTFPLLTWGSGTPPGTSLGFLAGAGGHLVTNINNKEIDLVIDQPPYIWTGNTSGSWVAGGPVNWIYSGSSAAWANDNYALFDDSLTANPSITISGVISGKTITFGNINTNYTITSVDSLNNLGGTSSLIMGGSGTNTLAGGANSYTGVTTINSGVLSVGTLANGGSPSDIGAATSAATNLVLNGGTLLYTGPTVSIDRLFSLGTAGGTIDASGSGDLTLNNPGAMGLINSGPRNLTLTGVDPATLATAVGDGGGPSSLAKIGTGIWILTGTNTYSGGTTLVAGELIVGTGGSGGTLGLGPVVDGTGIDFNRSGTLTVGGVVSGPGSVTNDGPGTVILANNNSYSGGTTINTGTLQVGNGGDTGSLNTSGFIVDNSLLTFNTSGTHVLNGVISGPGNVIVQGAGFQQCLGANSYTGWTLITTNAAGVRTIFQPCTGNQGALTTSIITNNGILRLDRQDLGVFVYHGNIVGSGAVQNNANNNNAGSVTLTGTNTYTGGTFIGDNILICGDNNGDDGKFVGNVTFTNNFSTTDDNQRMLDLNIFNNFTISGNIVTNFASPQINLGIVQLDGAATVTLTGNNTYGGGTIVNNGALIVGAGTTGSVGKGPVSLNNGNPLIINVSGNLNIPGQISGAANLVSLGSGTVTLNNSNNTYSGTTTVSNGMFFINGTNSAASTYVTNATFGGVGTLSGPVTLDTGTTLDIGASTGLAPVGTLTINNNLSIGGNLDFEVNKFVSPSNDFVVVNGMLTNTGTGTLTILNYGRDLAVGDRFTLFSQAVSNGAAITVTGAHATWTNNLAVDGSVSVIAVIPPPPLPTLNFTNLYTGTSSNSLRFSWSDSYSTFKLRAQTNNANVGLSTNWSDYPGGGTSPVTVPVVKTNGTVFFRLKLISTP